MLRDKEMALNIKMGVYTTKRDPTVMVLLVSIIILDTILKSMCVCVCLIEGSINKVFLDRSGLWIWRFFLSSFYFPVCSKCCTININQDSESEGTQSCPTFTPHGL